MRKKLFRILLLTTLAAALLCGGGAAAEIEMNYIGPLDTFTGQPVASAAQTDQGASLVRVSGTVQYDRETREFVYPVGTSARSTVRATVMDGMITDREVSIVADEGVELTLYHNGTQISGVDPEEISTPGEYVVTSGTGAMAADRLFSFTIVGPSSTQVKNYMMPQGFQIMEATLDGEPVNYDRSYIDLSAEGIHYIKYRCIRTDVVYELTYTADFTAPVLALAEVENGFAKGPVSIADLEPGAGIAILYNGEQIGYSEVLDRSGDYAIKVADAAGNVNYYEFTIQVYFDSNSLLFFAIIAGVLVGTVVYVVLSRKRLRVR